MRFSRQTLKRAANQTTWRRVLPGMLLLVAGWCFLWLYPWQPVLQSFLWLRLGIALVMFLVPGICLYGFLKREDASTLNYLTFGFVLSHILWGVFGLAGRLFHLSFEFIQHGMLGLSLILMIVYVIPRWSQWQIPKVGLPELRHLAGYWPLALTILLTALMVLQRTISDDDLAYLAYITNWQKSAALDFNDVFFGADRLTAVRFWIMNVPFVQAFLAETSHLAGIYLTGGFYEPFLVMFSLLGTYELARSLGLSRSAAMLSAALQVIFLALLSEYLHPGASFFRQLSVDKATSTFIVVPVFLQSVLEFWHARTPQTILLLLLTGLSLMMMHPVILLFAVMIVGLMALFNLSQSNLPQTLTLFGLLLIILAPQVATRFIPTEAQGVVPYTPTEVLKTPGIETMIRVWGDTNFYGFNPSNLAMNVSDASNRPTFDFALQYGWILIPLLTVVFAIKNIRQSTLAQYILACFILVALAGLPFTGWLLGYFVSAFMLERTTWLYPYGIGTVYLGLALGRILDLENRFTKWTNALHTKLKIAPTTLASFLAQAFAILLILLIMRNQNLPDMGKLEVNTQRYQEFSLIGDYWDEQISGQAFVAGSEELNDFIPALSAKAKVISYRPSDPSYPYFYSPAERERRLLDRRALFSTDHEPEDKLTILQKYEIRYLWLKTGEYYMVKQLITKYPSDFEVKQVGRYYVIRVK